MTTNTKKLTYREPYEEFKRCICGRPFSLSEYFTKRKCPICRRMLIFFGDSSIKARYYKEYKKCLCGRPYFYLESLKRCPVCGRKLIFYGDLVNEIILGYYYTPPYLRSNVIVSLIERLIFFMQELGSNIHLAEIVFDDEEKKGHLKDAMVFLRLFLKETDRKYQIIWEKEKSSKLSEKDPFENLIIKKNKHNQCLNAFYGFFDEFPIKSVSKEQIFKDLQNSPYFSKWKPRTLKFILNYKKDSKCVRSSVFLCIVNQSALFELCKYKKKYQNIQEYKDYRKLEKELKKAEREYSEAAERYYKSEEERAKQINQSIG